MQSCSIDGASEAVFRRLCHGHATVGERKVLVLLYCRVVGRMGIIMAE